ncbi:putative Jasmonic acid-amido synthetase JAR1 [Hypsibius exemplaris]|uniref:Jasmonic acid-amido synthetase JAR1 n=1 Tax=Hypsibius exemplaris TaxID=2072580 RepID=A0A1W0WR81_HYPEX|nr:putative Jasmonic acid-amido synthetase JAR1 [Hypsibius exemplaris]
MAEERSTRRVSGLDKGAFEAARHGRRASFVERAVDQGRRPSILERAVDAIQAEVNVNTELAVVFNFTYLWVTVAGGALLPFLLPITSIIIGSLLLGSLFVTIDFLGGWNPEWSFKVAAIQYFKVRVVELLGLYNAWLYHRNSLNVRAAQEATLLTNLAANRDTEYYRDHNLGSIENASDFLQSQPLSKYDKYRPYVDRMLQGELKVLTSEVPYYFGKTSGTTGLPAAIPITPFIKKQTLAAIACFLFYADRKVPWKKLHNLRPVWKISYTNPKVLEKTPSGIILGPMSANPLWTKGMGEIYTVPSVTFQIEDSSASGYVQLIFALRYRDLGAIEGTFASIVYFSFKRMEADWRSLVENIRNGTIRQDLNISDDIREILLAHLKPDQARADFLEEQFEEGFDNIAARIWPEMKLINCITTGPFEIYAKHLREKYTKDILLYSASVVATEGFMALNMWPYNKTPRYALIPKLHFYEFIPIDLTGEAQPGTLLMDQVEIGHDYEIVITSANGFNRYRIGDVVRVVGFYNQIPLVEFRHRAGANLNIKGEKVTELSMIQCLTEAAHRMPEKIKEIVDYTSCENVMLDVVGFKNDRKGSYHVLFVELTSINRDANHSTLAAELASVYDEILRNTHYKYIELRTTKSLDEVLIYPIQAGGFSRLRDYLLKTTSVSPIQLKIPRVLLKKEIVTFMLNERV